LKGFASGAVNKAKDRARDASDIVDDLIDKIFSHKKFIDSRVFIKNYSSF
jgi:hypothetical protein